MKSIRSDDEDNSIPASAHVSGIDESSKCKWERKNDDGHYKVGIEDDDLCIVFTFHHVILMYK